VVTVTSRYTKTQRMNSNKQFTSTGTAQSGKDCTHPPPPRGCPTVTTVFSVHNLNNFYLICTFQEEEEEQQRYLRLETRERVQTNEEEEE